jgi:hypothetical protein
MLPPCGHAIPCEVSSSSYIVCLPTVRAKKLVDGRSTVQASGRVT